jgi:hypothetical protein
MAYAMEIDRMQIAKETHQAISGTKSDPMRISFSVCSLVIGLLATVGCQKSQPYVLGSMPNYLRPYSPGAPVVVSDAANPAASTPLLHRQQVPLRYPS